MYLRKQSFIIANYLIRHYAAYAAKRHLPHRITLEQTFYTDQGKGSRRESYKAYFPVKPFRQRYDEQDRSRKKADQTFQDKFVKIAEISLRCLSERKQISVPR